MQFCYPNMSDKGKEVCDYDGYDLALADKLIAGNASVVCNDFYLEHKERIFVVSGPNQGGKTTTNDREGSETARQIVCALLEKRIKIFFVTHLYEFAHGF